VLVEGAGKPSAGSIVASEVITEPGQVPIPFRLSYSGVALDPTVTYTLQATIVDVDRTWATGMGTPVITKGNPTSGLDLLLTYRADLLKGSVTGTVTGVGIDVSTQALSAAVLLDLANDATVGIDIRLAGDGVPVAFSVPFDPSTIDHDATYVVAAGIVDGEERWENRTGVPVITNGNPVTDVTVPVSAVVPPPDGGLGPFGWIAVLVGLLALVAVVILYMRSRRSPEPEPEPEGAAAAAAVGTSDGAEATSGWSTEEPAPAEEPPTWGESAEAAPETGAAGDEPPTEAASTEAAPAADTAPDPDSRPPADTPDVPGEPGPPPTRPPGP
jgi:uncharacterized lipoprotein YbaY